MSVIGHNNGPAMGQGRGWRTYCWRAARRELLPHMPLNVVRRRVKRAAELGLAYPAYARIHATSRPRHPGVSVFHQCVADHTRH